MRARPRCSRASCRRRRGSIPPRVTRRRRNGAPTCCAACASSVTSTRTTWRAAMDKPVSRELHGPRGAGRRALCRRDGAPRALREVRRAHLLRRLPGGHDDRRPPAARRRRGAAQRRARVRPPARLARPRGAHRARGRGRRCARARARGVPRRRRPAAGGGRRRRRRKRDRGRAHRPPLPPADGRHALGTQGRRPGAEVAARGGRRRRRGLRAADLGERGPARAEAGCTGRDRRARSARRRDHRDVRRLRLPGLQVQSRAAGAPAARLLVQAVHLFGRARGRVHAGLGRARRAGGLRGARARGRHRRAPGRRRGRGAGRGRLAPGQRLGPLLRPDPAARCAGAIAQPGDDPGHAPDRRRLCARLRDSASACRRSTSRRT